ncbi:MAG: hypothetical protein RJA36_1391 [Pseudomonadota bacterium]|jgi:hypothetical protein
MAKTQADTLAWAQLHGAVGESCAAWQDSREHHRALLADLRTEPREDWPWFTAMFKASAAAARAARQTNLGR